MKLFAHYCILMKQLFTLLLFTISATLLLNAQSNIDQRPLSFRYQSDNHTNSDDDKYKSLGDVKWRFKTGGKVFSSPVICDGVALIGSEDKNLYAVDVNTGKKRWQFKTGGAVHSSPALSNNTVFVGSFDGYFYALDFATGKQKWKLQTAGEKRIGDTSYWGMKPSDMYMEDLWDCFLSSPIVEKNEEGYVLYFGSSDGNLYAVDAGNGSIKWKFKTQGSIHASPTLYNGTIYIGGWDTYLYAINARTGKEQWKFKTGEQMGMTGIQSSVAAENGVVYFGARDAHLYALDALNGNLLWKYDAKGSWIIGSAVLKEHVLYVGTSDSYLLLALDAETGKEKYRLKMNGYVFGTPAVTGGTAYIGDFTGNLYALDLASKGRRWNRFSTESRKQHAELVLKNDTLDFKYAAKGGDLSFYSVNKKVMDDFYSLGSIVSSPVVKDDIIYFGSADGYLYALNLKKRN
jgi:outer membrane protein assembly factor BamB